MPATPLRSTPWRARPRTLRSRRARRSGYARGARGVGGAQVQAPVDRRRERGAGVDHEVGLGRDRRGQHGAADPRRLAPQGLVGEARAVGRAEEVDLRVAEGAPHAVEVARVARGVERAEGDAGAPQPGGAGAVHARHDPHDVRRRRWPGAAVVSRSQERVGRDRPTPRWSSSTRSRRAARAVSGRPGPTSAAVSRTSGSPGPPASSTMGSSCSGRAARTTTTARRMLRPAGAS